MSQKAIDDEVALIIKESQSIEINTTEDLLTYVRITVAASDRLLSHISNLTDATIVHRDSINQIQENINSLTGVADQLAQHSQVVWNRVKRSTRIFLSCLLFVAVVSVSYLWKLVGHDYKVAIISVLIGLFLPSIARWLYEEWNS